MMSRLKGIAMNRLPYIFFISFFTLTIVFRSISPNDFPNFQTANCHSQNDADSIKNVPDTEMPQPSVAPNFEHSQNNVRNILRNNDMVNYIFSALVQSNDAPLLHKSKNIQLDKRNTICLKLRI
jgi:hypothetical protein